jgi:hypothetical protein
MDILKGAALIATFIDVLTFFAEATPMKIGVVAFTTTLVLDRLTGSLHFFHRHLHNAKDY